MNLLPGAPGETSADLARPARTRTEPRAAGRSIIRRARLGAAAASLALLCVPAVAGAQPSASFTFSPSEPRPAQPVTFTSTSEGDEADIVRQEWDLDGDGSFTDASGEVAVRAFATTGRHTVSLRVTDEAGESDVTSRTVTVGDATAGPRPDRQPPVAAFSFRPLTPRPGEAITFTSASTDPDGSIVRLQWDLDNDSQFDDATGPTAVRVFAAPGSYVVSLRATDDRGDSTIAFQTVQVTLAPPAVAPPAPATPPVASVQRRSLLLLSPFPIVRIRGTVVGSGVRVSLLTVRAGAGTRIVVSCRGRTCPVRRVVRRARSASRPVRFAMFERRLATGVVLEVRATKPARIGKYTRFQVRGRAAPARRDLCMRGTAPLPSPCPLQ